MLPYSAHASILLRIPHKTLPRITLSFEFSSINRASFRSNISYPTRRHNSITSTSRMPDTIATNTVEKDGVQYRTITEGKATVLVPQGAKIAGDDKGTVQQVFYNPIQQFNRDLSVLAIKTYGEECLERRKEQFEARMSKQGLKRKRRDDDSGDTIADKKVQEAASQNPEAADPDADQAQSFKKDYKPAFKILDALSASGLRALRYAHELPFVTSVVANDLSESAAESIKANVAHNALDNKITVNNDDALALMYQAVVDDLRKKDKLGNPGKANKFDVIDLDPYGTAAPFFDAAVQAVRDDGGLLCVTCTDSAVWAGHSYSEKTFALYGGIPVHGGHSHEAGLRLILNSIATSAARYGLAIEPLLSLSIDFYTKVFVRVTKSPSAVKFLGAKTMTVYSCGAGCGSWTTQHLMKSKPSPNKKGDGYFYKHVMAQGPTTDSLCQHCGSKTHVNGPMWGGHLHNPEFVQRLLDQIPEANKTVYKTMPRLEGMLRTVLEERIRGPAATVNVPAKDAQAAEIDYNPFYIIPSRLAGSLCCISIPDDMFRGALVHLGYQVGRSHCKAGSIKTDAPWTTIWWIMTEWVRKKHPVKVANIKVNSPAHKILSKAGLLGPGADQSTDMSKLSSPKDEDTKMEGVSEQEDAIKPSNDAAESNQNGEELNIPQTEEELRKTLVFNEELAHLGHQHAGQRILRYQMNPEKNWGPLTKARAQ